MIEISNNNVIFNGKLVGRWDLFTRTYYRYGLDKYHKGNGYAISKEVLDYLKPTYIVIEDRNLWTSYSALLKFGTRLHIPPFEEQILLEEKYWGGAI